MLDRVLDWRSTARWGTLEPLLTPLATDDLVPRPRPPHFVLRWLCQHCERQFLGDAPAPQHCPGCGRLLVYIATWDLRREYRPRWWADPGALP
jgi:hypothetical protein